MSKHSKWSGDTFKVFEKPFHSSSSSSTPTNNSFPSHFNLTAKSFIPTNQSFDPFQQKEEEEEEDMTQLSQHLISSHLLDEEEDDNIKERKPYVWDTQQDWNPLNQPLKDIWKPAATEKKTTDWNNFETSTAQSRVVDDEFDPTLQFYHGSLYDAYTIEDINLLSLNVTNPSLEETEAENVGEDMSTLQMMQTIFSDLSDDELQETLARHDYDVDRAIESLLTKKMTVEPPPTVKKRQVCRHFLAGECYRKDCWFVHDLQEKVCKFWLQGSCLKGDSCEFSHVIDVKEVANKITTSPPIVSKPVPKLNSNGDYPQLSSKTTLVQQNQPALVEDEFPSLASASKMTTKKSPITAIKGGINFAEAAKKKGAPQPQQQPQKKKASTDYRSHSGGFNSSLMKKLTQPVRIPWLDTGSSLNTVYMKEREQAIEYGMLRNRFFSRATEYYLKGDGAKAKLYSMEAKHYNRLMQEMHMEASKRIFESRSQHEAFIDLHGLHEDEAIEIIEQRLHQLKSTYHGIIYIVTGTGHHSGASGLSKKESKLKPSVYNYLRQENYRFAETTIVGDSRGGVFAVLVNQ